MTMAGELSGLARALIVIGLALAGIGALLSIAGRFPWLGRLPGDILIRRDGFTVYFPLTSGLLLSALLTLALRLVNRR